MGKEVLILRKRKHTNSSDLLHSLIHNFKCSHSLISDLACSCEIFSSLYFELLKVPLTCDPVCVLGFKGRPWAVSRPVSTRREGKKSANGLCIGLLFFPLVLLVFLFSLSLPLSVTESLLLTWAGTYASHLHISPHLVSACFLSSSLSGLFEYKSLKHFQFV